MRTVQAQTKQKPFCSLTSLALLFPAALTVFTKSSLADAASTADFHAFYDSLVNYTLAYGAMLLLPCLFGCVGALLFFSERDCDTFKNLQAIPVTRNQLIFAKLGVLYLWSELYALCSGLAVTFFCFVLEPRTPLRCAVQAGLFPPCGAHHGNGLPAGGGAGDLQQPELSVVAAALPFCMLSSTGCC